MSEERESDYQTMLRDCTWIVIEAITQGESVRLAVTRIIAYVRAHDKERAAAGSDKHG